jgi:class 3 adenylate cyclase
MTAIAEWLASIGLGEYSQCFAENGIDLSVVPDLTEQDLKDLGVLLGHRRKVLRAIADMKGSVVPTPLPAPKPVPRTDAERRQLTIMFCDLVGSSELAVRLDPEDLRRVIGAYHNCIKEIIARHQGIIARYMGDGVLAYFGYPQAHEHDAEQATRAGLTLVEAVARLQTDIGTELHVRVGIATGTVIVGDLIGEGAPKLTIRSFPSIEWAPRASLRAREACHRLGRRATCVHQTAARRAWKFRASARILTSCKPCFDTLSLAKSMLLQRLSS